MGADKGFCSRCHKPFRECSCLAAQPDPKDARKGQPLTMLFVGATEAQKDMMLSAECAASSWRDVFAERDQFRARVQELERIAGGLTNTLHDVGDTHAQAVAERDQLRARVTKLEARERELEQTIRLSDYEIRRLMSLVVEAAAERDVARAECQRLEAQAARMRECLSDVLAASQMRGAPVALERIHSVVAETDAGALGLGLVEALRKAWIAWGQSGVRMTDAALYGECERALSAWNRCGRGRDGDA